MAHTEQGQQITIDVDPERCHHDGLCSQICPNRIFVQASKAPPTIDRPESCCFCGQCVAVCPHDAIAHASLPADGFAHIEDPKPVTPEALAAFLRQRRSVRVYRDDRPIPRELLEEIAILGGYAPTGAFEGVGWVRRVTIVSGDEKMTQVREATVAYMRKLRKLLGSVLMKAVAAVSDAAKGGLLTLPDIDMRLREWEAGRDAITYDAPAAIFVTTTSRAVTPREDCDAALMNILLGAAAQGLGTCWNGWLAHAAAGDHVPGFSQLSELLDLPEDHGIVEATTLGWPKVKLHSVPHRETELSWIE